MADYIYLLENRLSPAQQNALVAIREIARAKGLTLFLVGGAVRDLTSGSPVRDLDVAVQGSVAKLRKDLEKAGAQIAGSQDATQALYVRFPGNARAEISSTLAATWPKPGKPVYKPGSILDDLRRRDFTANAMALSLNEGSYGLLMDPLNGVADIENRELRLVSNYGFIEEPVRMIRAQRLSARLGWQLEEKTQSRYETGKAEGYISTMNEFQRGYELEEIVHEEDPLRVLERLESEGWMNVLCPAWTTAKVNVNELERLREVQGQLQLQGILADPAAAQFPLLTANMAAKDVAALKTSFPRQGFVAEIDALESEAKQFAAELGSKHAATPSSAWRMIFAAPPEVVLWVAYSTRSSALQAKFKSFYTDWPAARQRIPYALLQEMRIVPELAGYNELVEKLFFELMDMRLGTTEEMKAFLEPHSPPAPPPPVNMRRPRGAKGARAGKGRKRADPEAAADETEESNAASELTEDVTQGVDGTGLPDDSRENGEESLDEESGSGGAQTLTSASATQIAAPANTAKRSHAAKAVQKNGSAAQASRGRTSVSPAAKGPAKTAGVTGKKPLAAKTGPAKPAKKTALAKKTAAVKKAATKAAPHAAKAKKTFKAPPKGSGRQAAKPARKAAKTAAPSVAKHTAHAASARPGRNPAGNAKAAAPKKAAPEKSKRR